jgi:hypothetical protein
MGNKNLSPAYLSAQRNIWPDMNIMPGQPPSGNFYR